MGRELLVLVCLAACSGRGLPDDPVRDGDPPRVEVSEPARGAILQGDTVTVRGRVTDVASGIQSVKVNDRPARIESDGRFEATVTTLPGITLLRTIVTDTAGNTDADTRAVLGGNLVPLDTPVEHALTADVSAEAFGFVGTIAARAIDGIDLNETVAALNPVVDVGVSCLRARVDVVDFHKGPAHIDLQPVAGGLSLFAEVADVEIKIHVAYSAFCNDGEAEVTVRARRFHAAGTLTLGVTPITGSVEVEMSNTTAGFDDFSLEQDVLPADVVDLLDGPLGAALAGVIAQEIETQVPGLVGGLLGDLAKTEPFSIGGKTVHVGVWIKGFDFTEAGGKVAIDESVYVENTGATGLVYLSNPRPAPTFDGMIEPGAFRVAVADDALNQLLASLWAAGILDQSVPVGQRAGGIFDRVELTLALPPVVSALPHGGGVRVTAGDILCTFIKDGQVVTKLALAADTVLSGGLTADNRIQLSSGSPTVYLDVLEEGVNGANPFAQGEIEQLGSFVATSVVAIVGDLIRNVPVPAIPGATLTGATLTTGDAQGGYVLVSGQLR